MKVRITPTYVAAAFLVFLVLFSALFTIGSWLNLWGDVEVYAMIQTFILNWVIVITFAILGGILFGMYVGFRLLASQGFTPFEKSMLTMITKVDDIHKRMKEIEERIDSIGSNEDSVDPKQKSITSEVNPNSDVELSLDDTTNDTTIISEVEPEP